ncbi:MAG: ABC transporter substrate-binding protein [Planctomycetes bacterium]|nr:ABC transporter substrate-binding protein [Planctomycetota bacterium]
MRSGQMRRLLSFGLLSLLPGGLWAVAGCSDPAGTSTNSQPAVRKQLTIITPHSKKIRDAFEVEFSNWHNVHRGSYVSVDWIATGTPKCVEYITSVFRSTGEGGPSKAPDIMFGGGIADHLILAERGYSRKVGSVRSDLPAEVSGLSARDPESRWFATGLTTFGIVFNQAACEQRGIAPPTTWADLADPRFFGWIGLADPMGSGSNRQCLNLMLQKVGWQEGWATTIRLLANARALLDSSRSVLEAVDRGVFLAAFAVNFDGLDLAEASGGRVRYINPPGATAVTPEVLSVLRCARDRQLAEDFLNFCLSDEGQVLWGVRSDQRASYGRTLHHYPVAPNVYTEYAGKLAVDENPFETDFGLKLDLEGSRRRTAILKPLMLAATGDNHILLQRAWEEVINAGTPAEALMELTTPPFSEEEAYALGQQYQEANEAEASRLMAEWSQAFASRYERVLEMVGG